MLIRRCNTLCVLWLMLLLVSPTVIAASTKPVTITMSVVDKVTSIPWQEEVVRRFHEAQDAIRIELVHLSGSGRREKMLTMAAAGTPLNIGYDDPPPIVSWAKQGLVKELNHYLERDQDLYQPFWPVLKQLALVDGKQYAVPLDLQVTGLYYNATMFHEAGVTVPWDGMSWEDIMRFGPKLVKRNHDGTVQRWAVQFPRWIIWWYVAWAFGADFFDDPTTPTKFIGDSPEMIATLNFFYDAIHGSGIMAPRTVSQGPQEVLLTRKNVTMSMNTTISIGQFLQLGSPDAWDVARHPYGPAGNSAETHGLMWFLFKDANHPDEAWEVLKFFSSEESMRLSVEMQGILVPHRKAAQLWMQLDSTPTNRLSFIQALDSARTIPAVAGGEIRTAIEKSLFPFVEGKIPLSQVLEDWRTTLPELAENF
ncbi:MAG: ABC transporter substrate-binding protein [Limnochordia bacterium]